MCITVVINRVFNVPLVFHLIGSYSHCKSTSHFFTSKPPDHTQSKREYWPGQNRHAYTTPHQDWHHHVISTWDTSCNCCQWLDR